MGTVTYTDKVHCGFGVIDQRGLVKFNTVVQFVMDIHQPGSRGAGR